MVGSIEFSMYTIMSSANNYIFTSSFPIWMPFISSFCLITELGLLVLCWIRDVEADVTVLFLILREMLVVFACWVWCWQWVCHIWPLLWLMYISYIPALLRVLIINQYCIKCFFCIYRYDHVVFILHFVYVVNYTFWFANVVPTLHSWNKSHLIMAYDLFDVLLYSVCEYFVEVPIFIKDIGI